MISQAGGGVATKDESRLYAKWLKSHKGEYDDEFLLKIFPLTIIVLLLPKR